MLIPQHFPRSKIQIIHGNNIENDVSLSQFAYLFVKFGV